MKLTDHDLLSINGGTRLPTPLNSEFPEAYDFGFHMSRPGDGGDAVVPFLGDDDGIAPILGDQVFLWDACRAVNGGEMPAFNWQLTGSCTHGGAHNALTVLTCNQIAALPTPAVFKIPFALPAYGESRRRFFGRDTEGEGSSGDLVALVLSELGLTSVDHPSVPEADRPKVCGPALVYDRAVELKYSTAKNCPPAVREACKNHKIKYEVIASLEQAERSLRLRRPLTFAGSWGGLTSVPAAGGQRGPKVRLNRRATTWQHQQSVLGVFVHPDLGRIWYVQNQWFGAGPDMKVEYVRTRDGTQISRILQPGTAFSVHGEPLFGEPVGGYWIQDQDMQFQIRTGEVRALRALPGFTDGLLSTVAV